ncbi:MAG: hypothetical protein ACM3JG_10050 [Thiohalocapsa sp.]
MTYGLRSTSASDPTRAKRMMPAENAIELKVRRGTREPAYERIIFRALGIGKLKRERSPILATE